MIQKKLKIIKLFFLLYTKNVNKLFLKLNDTIYIICLIFGYLNSFKFDSRKNNFFLEFFETYVTEFTF
jgi:hypothetical protein